MKSSVIIKGNKYGFQIVLNPTLPFEELLREVAQKFKESIRFFDFSQSIAVSFEGRDLTQGEQNLLVDTIVENSGLKINYIINGGKAVETEFAEALSDIREEEENPEEEEDDGEEISFPESLIGKNGQFYRGTLRSGQKIEVDAVLSSWGYQSRRADHRRGQCGRPRLPERQCLCGISRGSKRICGFSDDGAHADSNR